MAQITWAGGRDMHTYARILKERSDNIKVEAEEALRISVEEGAVMQQDILEKAVTKTGLARVRGQSMAMFDENNDDSHSRFPGRHVTGNMIAAISNNGDRPQKVGTALVAAWGWFKGEMEKYFRDQDLGEGQIPAARSLSTSYMIVRERFRKRMADVVKGKPAR